MRNLFFGVAVALLVCTGLLVAQQQDIDIAFTVPADYAEVLKNVIAERQKTDPSSITDTQVRNAVVSVCRDGVGNEVKTWRRRQDHAAIQAMITDLTEAERAQVRALILSLAK